MAGTVAKALDGRIAVVTGGHDGIGYYVSQALQTAGVRVAILGRRAERLEQAAGAIGGDVVPVVCDLRDPDSVRQAFSSVDERLGLPDVLINNAAAFPLFKVAEATDEELQTAVGTNVLGVLYCMREAIARMRKCGGGDIVSLSSESVRRPFPYLATYAATKAAVETLSRGLKQEVRGHGIRVSVLCSGHVEVPDRQARNWDPERARAFYQEAEAGGYMAEVGPGIAPEATANAVLSLLSQPDDAVIDLLELTGR
jgi:NAD(P)-dependent dehydrogenase (short-subunit alcohol dehydrogenase family)